MLLLMDFCATNTLLSCCNCLYTYRTDCWLEGELSGGEEADVAALSITEATTAEAMPKFCFCFNGESGERRTMIQQSTTCKRKHMDQGENYLSFTFPIICLHLKFVFI